MHLEDIWNIYGICSKDIFLTTLKSINTPSAVTRLTGCLVCLNQQANSFCQV